MRYSSLTIRVAPLTAVLMLGGCALFESLQQPAPGIAGELTGVPHYSYGELWGGPTAVAMALNYNGAEARPEAIAEQAFTAADGDSLNAEMLAAPVYYGQLGILTPPTAEALKQELEAGLPVIVLLDVGWLGFTDWQYAVVIGYDAGSDEVVIRRADKQREVSSWTWFERQWSHSNYWAMVAVAPGTLPASVGAQPVIAATAALEQSGQHPAAAFSYVGILQRWPDNTAAQIGLANAWSAMGDLAGAEFALRSALEAQPENPALLNNLALVLLERGCAAAALPYAERARIAGGDRYPQTRETLSAARKQMQLSSIQCESPLRGPTAQSTE